ncbi:MAG: hypothetical protein HY583_04020 [Candidatus Omnitrophica bacterium]|nr:hypothetical protein [Candidatus Omnitrophota bacterium]
MKKLKTSVWILIFLAIFIPFANAYQDTNRFTYGFQRLLLAPFQIPIQVLQGTLYGPPIVGTLGGVLTGTFSTISNLVGGTFDMAASVAPYAKYAVFAL